MSTKVMQQRIADYFKTQPVLKAWLFVRSVPNGWNWDNPGDDR